jgi:hypothetical protein
MAKLPWGRRGRDRRRGLRRCDGPPSWGAGTEVPARHRRPRPIARALEPQVGGVLAAGEGGAGVAASPRHRVADIVAARRHHDTHLRVEARLSRRKWVAHCTVTRNLVDGLRGAEHHLILLDLPSPTTAVIPLVGPRQGLDPGDIDPTDDADPAEPRQLAVAARHPRPRGPRDVGEPVDDPPRDQRQPDEAGGRFVGDGGAALASSRNSRTRFGDRSTRATEDSGPSRLNHPAALPDRDVRADHAAIATVALP